MRSRWSRGTLVLAAFPCLLALFVVGCGDGVVPSLTGISLNPNGLTIQVGGSQQFAASGSYSDSSTSAVSASFSVTGNIGTVAQDGLFTATTVSSSSSPATGQVVASFSGFEATAPVTVTVGEVAELEITWPPGVDLFDLTVGDTVDFNATGLDQYGNRGERTRIEVTPTWSVNGSIGTIDANGLFQATDIGTGQVVATVGSVEETVDVVVEPLLPAAGRIAFISSRDGNPEIYVMNSDGTNQTNLTNNPAEDRYPLWSPDGSKIAFASYRDANYEIYVMNFDGTNQTRLTNSADWDTQPFWSPDGSKIVFTSGVYPDYEIWLMNSDGTNQVNLTNNPAKDGDPTWSPDGTKIAFISNRDLYDEVYVMNSDGTNPINLTNNLVGDRGPVSWSPDGNKIAYISFGAGDLDVYVMNSDGTNQVNLTNVAQDDENASWSPDGSKILFESARDAPGEIYVMNSDGSNQVNLTADYTWYDSYPSWSPDGSKIAFYSARDDNYEIYVMNPDGSNQVNLTNNPANDFLPRWSPF